MTQANLTLDLRKLKVWDTEAAGLGDVGDLSIHEIPVFSEKNFEK